MLDFTCYFAFVCILIRSAYGEPTQPPNIVLILADDLGWNDVSFHGQNQFLTPNIDAIALNGIALQRHYVLPLCTPSRAALLTGRYGHHTGMFNSVIESDQPWGMPLTEKTLAEVLRDAGYSTHLIGKWHLGFFKRDYSPVNRGFDTFNGYLGSHIDYWDHSLMMAKRNYTRGYDMRNNLDVDLSGNGTYATDLFTAKAVKLIKNHDIAKPLFLLMSHLAPHTANEKNPMQAPRKVIDKFSYIKYDKRRLLAAMISRLDSSVGKIVKTLNKRNMLDNTIILFLSDNGAPTIGNLSNAGSNHPLRGQKGSTWEGATRGVAAIFSPLLKKRQRVSDQYVHITDWFKTFAELAGVDSAKVKPNLDGYDVWDALSYDLRSPRQEFVQNIDYREKYASFVSGHYKYIEGTTDNVVHDDWLGLIPFNTTIEDVNTDYANEIRNSEVGKALAQYTQLQQPTGCSNISSKLSDAIIYTLRQQTTINCAAPPSNPKYKCEPLVSPCMFDIFSDPCETVNLACTLPSKFKEMRARMMELQLTAVPARNKPSDPNSNPAFFNNTWTYWQDTLTGDCYQKLKILLLKLRYGHHTGMFNSVIESDQPWGMPLTEKTLAEVLRDAGYSTHLIGKWHLGFFKRDYSPVNRGFDTFNGYLGSHIDYWDHSLMMSKRNYTRGYDMRNNLDVDLTGNGTYATDLFTAKAVKLIKNHDIAKPLFLLMSHLAPHTANEKNPMQAPRKIIDKFNYIKYDKRRILAAMISRLDSSVGKIIKTLNKRNMLDNTIILFLSDNGAPTIGNLSNAGSNHPLRGQKGSTWEGATRGVAAVFSPLLKKRQRVSDQYVHITDWFKTFAELAGVDSAKVKPNLDGYDVWDALSYDLRSPRQEFVQNIDYREKYASFVSGHYKYIEGTTDNGVHDDWLGLIPFNTTIEDVNTDYANEIRNSEVGKALAQYTQLQQPTGCSNISSKLSDAIIYTLRQQTTINCAAPPSNPKYKCEPLVSPCMFDIFSDPCETVNLACTLPSKFKEMRARMMELQLTAVPARNKPSDPNSNPAFFNNTWTYWQDSLTDE